jgi:hypothetical protein
MNQGLSMYASDENVICIHGYIYPVKAQLPQSFFVRGAHCWGWATWKRGWDLYEEDGQVLLDELINKGLSWEFDYNGTYPFTMMLENQIRGLNNSWAIRWHAVAFLRNKLTLYPAVSLVRNIGFDQSGVHSSPHDRVYDTKVSNEEIHLLKIETKELPEARKSLVAFFASIRPTLLRRILRKLYFVTRRFKMYFVGQNDSK